MEEKKITKKEMYGMVAEIVAASDVDYKDELLAFVEKEVAMIEAKAEKAKARAAEKRAEGDELRDAVQAVLTDDYQTIDAILVQIEGEEITKAKVTARLTALVKAGIAEKTDVKNDENKTQKAYKLV